MLVASGVAAVVVVGACLVGVADARPPPQQMGSLLQEGMGGGKHEYLRPPCAPLLVTDPLFSYWSCSDNLYDTDVRFWTGEEVTVVGLISVDGAVYRWMGRDDAPPLPQEYVRVQPTSTTYVFMGHNVSLSVTFTTPGSADPEDLDALAEPGSFINFHVAAVNVSAHRVRVYLEVSGQLAVSADAMTVVPERVPGPAGSALSVLRIGRPEPQQVMASTADRISWGHLYLATPSAGGAHASLAATAAAPSGAARGAFRAGWPLPSYPDAEISRPRAAWSPGGAKGGGGGAVLALEWDLGSLAWLADATFHAALAYDTRGGQRYFGTEMPTYWSRLHPGGARALLESMEARHVELTSKAEAADASIQGALSARGGSQLAQLGALAWRQVTGGLAVVWDPVRARPWAFLKEVSSDGDVSTVDVIYPACPMLVWAAPRLLRTLLEPILSYANNETLAYGKGFNWTHPWAPHHLGRWPISDLDPRVGETMPLEESANMLIMLAAVGQHEVSASGNSALEYLSPYWPLLEGWGNYSASSLPDPGDQLCTDDFEGPSPHNANLAAKGVVGLGALAWLERAAGRARHADHFRAIAEDMAGRWGPLALDPPANASWPAHYRLQYDRPMTWSLKYNLFFDKSLGLGLFPPEVVAAETAFYPHRQHAYGIPLDSRAGFTKTDWEMFVGAMGTEVQFRELLALVWKFAHTTKTRRPLTDWYDTWTGDAHGWFMARPVVGAVFARMIDAPPPPGGFRSRA